MRIIENPKGIAPCLNLKGTDCLDCDNRDGEIGKQDGLIVKVACTARKMHEALQTLKADKSRSELTCASQNLKLEGISD